MIPTNKAGESMPLLEAVTSGSFIVDGSIAHAESAKLPQGVYRIAVRSSTADAGVMLKITTDIANTATTTTGMFMAQGSTEYIPIPEGSYISVIDGKINVTPFN
jgi:hypothetical protein